MRQCSQSRERDMDECFLSHSLSWEDVKTERLGAILSLFFPLLTPLELFCFGAPNFVFTMNVRSDRMEAGGCSVKPDASEPLHLSLKHFFVIFWLDTC